MKYGFYALPFLLVACGGAEANSPATVTTAEPVATTNTNATTPEGDLRAKTAAKYVAAIQGPEIDPAQRGRLAANGFSEELFGLPKSLRTALEAVTGSAVDPSQRARIVAAIVDEPDGAGLAKRCGMPVNRFLDTVTKTEPTGRVAKIRALCKLDAGVTDEKLAHATAAGLLLNMIVTDALDARGSVSPAERALAAEIVAFE